MDKTTTAFHATQAKEKATQSVTRWRQNSGTDAWVEVIHCGDVCASIRSVHNRTYLYFTALSRNHAVR